MESVLKNYHKLLYLTETGDLKAVHSYYYQIMTYLGILNLAKASLIVWSQVDFKVIEVGFDKNVWDRILQDSETYYYQKYLPEFLGTGTNECR